MKVLVTGKLPDEIISTLNQRHDVVANRFDFPMPREEVIEQVRDKDGLLCMITDRIDDELMEQAPGLRMIANYGVGYDHIDLASATARGIWVSNTPGVLTDATAEVALALILSVARRVVEGDAIVRTGKFGNWAPMLFLGTEVSGKTLGIVGLGQIGKAVARRAAGFSMRILYHNRSRIPEDEEKALNATYVDLKTLLSESDFVSLHVSLNEQSRHLIGPEELRLMKPTSYLINVSRGPVIDETALVAALQDGRPAGAGLDVYENEPEQAPGLTDLSNVVLLPHVGSATVETRRRMASLAVENLLQGLEGTPPPNRLNCGFR
ncbi:MAG: D-glycerate dehydrogenase [Desulfomonilaceae bacterium]|nr:D-glycerate dehydrogenase [Desulfomonilaceae bacterium]